MAKHGIIKIGKGKGFEELYYEFESQEAKEKYFKNYKTENNIEFHP